MSSVLEIPGASEDAIRLLERITKQRGEKPNTDNKRKRRQHNHDKANTLRARIVTA